MREAVLALQIGCHALIKALSQTLAVPGLSQKLLVRGIAEKSDFGEHGWHIHSSQDHKRRTTHAAVLRAAGRALDKPAERVLNVFGKHP